MTPLQPLSGMEIARPGQFAPLADAQATVPLPSTPAGASSETLTSDFAHAVQGMLNEVETRDIEAEQLKRDLLTGEPVELHEVLLAVEKAHLSFQTLLAVRTRALEAYQELARMPL